MNINFVLSPYPSYAGSIKCAVYEASNPTAEVASQTFAAPHSSPRAVSFTGLDSVVHLVKVIALTGPTELHSWMHNPMETQYTIYTPLYFEIGDGGTYTPAAGTTECRNPYFEGKTFWVERRGQGTMVPGTEIDFVNSDPDFGFDLVKIGDTFNNEEKFVIHFHPVRVTSLVNESVAGKWFDGTTEITADTSWTTAHLKKLLLLRGSGTTITYTLPLAANAPVGYVFAFQTFGSGWTNHVIASPATNINDTDGNVVNSITIAANQFLYLVYNGVKFEVVAASDLLPFTISDNPDLNDASVVASTVATKTLADRIGILGKGKFNIGDIPGGDTVYSQTFTNATSADYIVMVSFKSNSVNHARDNTIGWCWYKDETTPNTKFKILVQELNSEVQNVEACWVVYKI